MTSAAPDALRELLARGDVARLMELLNGGSAQTRIIGGAVRNSLLGVGASDIDMATTLLPEAVMRRARSRGLKVVPTGIEHGTVTVIVDETPFEVTTLRQDIETDGRRARVRFGEDFREDALRRDFTINALSLDAAGTVYDYAGGLEDLSSRRIRFIGDAGLRIREDYLRILRFFRFHAQYGHGELDAAGYAACIAGRSGLPKLSRERIRQETMKLLAAAGAVAAIEALAEAGLLEAVIGGVARPRRLARLVALMPGADVVLRLGALAVAIREDVARLRDALRLTRLEEARLGTLAGLLERFHAGASLTAEEARRLIYRQGAAAFADLAAILAAQGQALPETVSSLAGTWQPPQLPFKGRDVVALGIDKGPEVGAILQQAEEDWIAAGFPLDAEACRRLLAGAAGKGR